MDDNGKGLADIKISNRPYILIRSKEGDKKIILEKNKYTLGREKADIIIHKRSVSRKHAEFIENWGGYTIKDANSNNGTFVNNIEINQECQLNNGDVIKLAQKDDNEPVNIIFYNPLSDGFKHEGGGNSKESEPMEEEDDFITSADKNEIKEISDIESPLIPKKKSKTKVIQKLIIIIAIIIASIGLIFLGKILLQPEARRVRIQVITPRSQHPGGLIKIIGSNFALDENRYSVYFAESEGRIISASSDEIIIRVPEDALPGQVIPLLKLDGHDVKVPGISILQNPTIISIDKNIMYPGDKVRILGRSFSEQRDENKVYFLEKEAEIISSDENEIIAIVPDFPQLERKKDLKGVLVVRSNLLSSNSIEVNIKERPVKYIEHTVFFEQIEDKVLIRNESIAFMAIKAQGEYSDTEERANAIAENLNELFNNIHKGIDLRYSSNSIDLIIDNSMIYSIRLYSEDIELYREMNPNTSINGLLLSKWFTAVVRDYLNTFIINEEPIYTIRQSYGGRVLSYIYDNYNKKTEEFQGITENYMLTLRDDYRKYLKETGIRIPSQYCDITGNYKGRAADNLTERPISSGHISLEMTIGPRGNRMKISHIREFDRTEDTGSFSQQVTRDIGDFRVENIEVFEPFVKFSINMNNNIISFDGRLYDNGIRGIFSKRDNQTGRFVLTK